VPNPEVIGSSRSTYTRAILMVCEEKGIQYTLTETAVFAPELFGFHPLGKMLLCATEMCACSNQRQSQRISIEYLRGRRCFLQSLSQRH
jgi:hypothetical protein